MLRNYWFAGVACAALAAVAQSAAAVMPLADDAKAFGTREQVQTMTMSPDGSKVAMLVAGAGSVTVLQVVDLGTGKIARLTSSDGRPQALKWCRFAGNNQLVCKYGGVAPVQDTLASFSRLIAISVDGKKMTPLGQSSSDRDARLRQTDGDIVDWLSDSDGQILMARNYVPEINTTGSMLGRSSDGLGIDRIDLRTLKSARVEAPRASVDAYMSDGLGRVRIYTASETQSATGLLTGLTRIKYRAAGSRDWRDLGAYNSITDEGLYPLAVDGDTDSLYALKDVAGRDTLVRVKLDGSGGETAVASHSKFDIDGVVRLGANNRVIGYTYADERRHHVYFDPAYNRLQSSLRKAVPKMPLIDFLGASADGNKLLVYASGDIAPGTFFRFDRASSQLEELTSVRPALDGSRPARPRRSRYQRRDDLER